MLPRVLKTIIILKRGDQWMRGCYAVAMVYIPAAASGHLRRSFIAFCLRHCCSCTSTIELVSFAMELMAKVKSWARSGARVMVGPNNSLSLGTRLRKLSIFES